MLRLLFLPWLLASIVCSQQAPPGPPAVALPRILPLGPLPRDAPVFAVASDGALTDGSGAACRREAFAAVVAKAPPTIALRVARSARAAAVAKLVADCERAGVLRIAFVATTPSGSAVGTFTMALAPVPAAGTDDPAQRAALRVRMHRERPGVPPESLELPLRRLRIDVADVSRELPAVLVLVAEDAPFELVLRTLASIARTGGTQAWLRCAEGNGAVGADAAALPSGSALAIDLDTVVTLRVRGVAIPLSADVVDATPRGLLTAPELLPSQRAVGGVGGAYGGRLDPPRRRAPGTFDWLAAQQSDDGGFLAGGVVDVEATALMALSLLEMYLSRVVKVLVSSQNK